ncbi:hypothetical protein FOA43_000981 [Brettanomyces nanus]|uniref:DAGKc domain-containing protein n=1 Tax=Eeniella nana TaxID=13502 RepID=A0A875RY98_EENNA|nr:uncharacterized protein FOA43_000981 [Brettanomyces nanus]QPG73668.1 hypothetical protein FOA43_000981 [Brettanomyces nanus]
MKAYIETEGLVLKGQLPQLDDEENDLDMASTMCCVPFAAVAVGKGENFDPIASDRSLIPYKSILWSEPTESGVFDELEVSYARKVGHKTGVFTSVFTIAAGPKSSESSLISSTVTDDSIILSEKLMARAYPDSKPGVSVLVLINPHGGKGLSLKIYNKEVEPFLRAAHCNLTVIKTKYSGHATDIAEEMDIDKFDLILCASGDGIPHEVINGLYKRSDRAKAFNKLVITQVPAGSGNALSRSCLGTLEPSDAVLEILKGVTVRTDLMAVCSQDQPVIVSFLSQTYGIIAQADIGTEWMRWIGESRFDIGVLSQVLSGRSYPCTIAVKYIARTIEELSDYYRIHMNDASNDADLDDDAFELKYNDVFQETDDLCDISNLPGWEKLDDELCSNMGLLYSGKMPYVSKDTNFFPAALPHDGSMDIVVTDVRAGFFKTVDALLSLDKGLHVWTEEVTHSKVEAFRVIPRAKPGQLPFISVDGENFPFQPFQVEIMRGLMKTVMRDGSYTETGFLDNHRRMQLDSTTL